MIDHVRGASQQHDASLPDQPYRGLSCFRRRDRALFHGREDDALKCADLLDRDGTRFLLIHGTSGVGKSSFIRARLIPFLDEQRVGYRFLHSRRRGGRHADMERESALFVRCTGDPLGQFAETLVDFCGRPISCLTPNGKEREVDLPQLLAEVAGSCEPEKLRSALITDPALLGRIFSRLSHSLPFRMVAVVDQVEELMTLGQPDQVAQALRMLQGVVDAPWGFSASSYARQLVRRPTACGTW